MLSKQILITLCSCLLLLLTSCTTYKIKTPPRGETRSFYKRNSTELIPNTRYDFSKLNRNYGLVIMSYEIEGKTGSNTSELTPEVKFGIRIWEQRFSKKDWDVKHVDKTLELWEKNNYLSSTTTTTKVKIEVTFHRGRIVYGGRITASNLDDNIDDNLDVLMKFDDDCNEFLNTYQEEIAGIDIDTALVKYLSRF